MIQLQQAFKNWEVRNQRDKVGELKILIVGESTSAAHFAASEDLSWPRVFEKKINATSDSLGFKAKVYNEAIPGTNSVMITLKIREWLEKYQPHIVVSMMGINDVATEDNVVESQSWYKKLAMKSKIFKTAKYFIESDRKPEPHVPRNDELSLAIEEFNNYLMKAKFFSTADLINYYIKYGQRLKMPELRGELASYIGSRMHEISWSGKNNGKKTSQSEAEILNICYDFLEQVYSVETAVGGTIYDQLLCGKYRYEKWDYIFERAIELLRLGKRLNDSSISLIIKTRPPQKQDVYKKLLEELNIKIDDSEKKQQWSTQKSYQMLWAELKRKKIIYISMMYATGNVENLKRFFSSENIVPQSFVKFMYENPAPVVLENAAEEIIFVSNQNFIELCDETIGNCYTDMWTKRDGGRFGHTTTKGHELIAENIYQAVFKNKDIIKAKVYP